ncbi:hypothetical protein F4775DRAFT_122321 [Biscogniauxia sp. FL1348]|nr:hypothetical protein F4775DRAFT_122321 [Biscogniauxia sp. FL1348]
MGRQLVKNDGADIGTCPIGSVYYKCKLNNFDGCCRTDPCANPGPSPCKDEDNPSATPTSTSQTSDNDSTTSDATSTESPTTHASSATGTTLVTSVLSTTDATGGPTVTTETVSLPLPTGLNQGSDSSPSSSSSSLSKGEVVGASIGGTIGALALLLIIFLLIRRHRISKRMSSTRGTSPTLFDEKFVIDQTQSSPKGKGGENDVFAPFGGRANSQEIDRTVSTSRPGYIELDANDAERIGSGQKPVSELPLTPKQGPSSSPGSSQYHPSPLTPGQPGTQMEIQNQLKAENGNYAKVNDDATVDSHRATLNPTKNERANGYHVLSWNGP